MMIKNSLIYILTVVVLHNLGGCGIYSTYQAKTPNVTPQIYGDALVDSVGSMAQIEWQDFFQDDYLRQLIDTAMSNNRDLVVARLNSDIAAQSLKSAKLAFISTLEAIPSYTYTGTSFTEMPLTSSWQIDIFGQLRGAKKRQAASLMQSKEYVQAVESQIIAQVATSYYTLLSLDAQLEVYQATEKSWKSNVETTRHLMDAGKYNAASLSQTQANYYSVCTYVIDIKDQISAVENILCSLLAIPSQKIKRGNFDKWQMPCEIAVGVPLSMIERRADVRSAQYNLEAAFYDVIYSRSQMYPSIKIAGSAEFYNSIYGVMASLVQPIFSGGRLRSQYNSSKYRQEQALIEFRQKVIDAGIEVNDAYKSYNAAIEKGVYYDKQVAALDNAVKSTQMLMSYGSATYLEVLTAQQTLLNAQISQITNRFNSISSVISLYQALGGGC